jgi:G:T-mismatch repair DNA endonuclease (very short patch repair protein)
LPRPRRRGQSKGRIPWKVIRKSNRQRKPSSLEKKVYDWLEEDEISFTKEKSIGKFMHVDVFFAPKLCIELNGCHWHGCKICNKELSPNQQKAQAKDAKRYYKIRKLGFDIVVFWECEVHEFPDRVREQLRVLARRT